MSSADTTTADAPEEDEPRDEQREALLEVLQAELGDAIVGSHIRPGDDLWVRVARDSWRHTAEVCRLRLACEFFDFLSALDWLPSPYGRDMDSQEDLLVHGADDKEPAPVVTGYAGGDTRFQVFARLASVSRPHAVTLKTDLPDDDLSVESITTTYAGANWHERETAEMFGIDFVGHPNLTPLYLPSDFEGYPLRKDFPLLARRVKPWPGIVDVEPMPGGDDGGEGGDDA